MVSDELRSFLERVYRKYARPEYLETDPLPIVRRYESPGDRETVALLTALLSYGRVAAIRRHVEEVLALMGGSPARFVRRFDRRRDGRAFLALRYRFHTGADLAFLLEALGDVYRSHRSLEEVFLEGGEETRDRLGALVGRIRLSLRGGGADLRSSYGLRFLLAPPRRGEPASGGIFSFDGWSGRMTGSTAASGGASTLRSSSLRLMHTFTASVEGWALFRRARRTGPPRRASPQACVPSIRTTLYASTFLSVVSASSIDAPAPGSSPDAGGASFFLSATGSSGPDRSSRGRKCSIRCTKRVDRFSRSYIYCAVFRIRVEV